MGGGGGVLKVRIPLCRASSCKVRCFLKPPVELFQLDEKGDIAAYQAYFYVDFCISVMWQGIKK